MSCGARIIHIYSSFLFRYPLIIFVLSLFFAGFVPSVILFFRTPHLTENAEIGFDTKGTEYSGGRLTWRELSITLQKSNRVEMNEGRSKRSWQEDVGHTDRRIKRGWAEDLLVAMAQIACYETPIPLMEHLSQVVIQLPSIQSLFHINTVSSICRMQKALQPQLDGFNQYTPYRSIWSFAAYAACLSPRELTSCSNLTQTDLDSFRNLLSLCIPHRESIIKCGTRNASCTVFPANCSSVMLFDLFYRILPKDLTASPINLNLFLPVFTLTGYATQNIQVPIYLYDNLEKAVVQYTADEGLILKGLAMDVKREKLLNAAIKDSYMALVSAILVLICVILHSRSILYAVAVALQLFLSVVASLAIYAFFTLEFPLLNLVTFVLLIAIASDDAFLLHSAMPEQLNLSDFKEALCHLGGTMFLTSFSTAVPFYLNVFSDVLVFRSFGLFAGTTMVVNYLLVISFLPSFVLLQRKWLNTCDVIPSLGSYLSYGPHQCLPWVLLKGRFLWLSSLSVVLYVSVSPLLRSQAFISALAVSISHLHLPEYNPLQLFVGSNLHEWYDNHAEILFPFVQEKVAIPISTRLVFGLSQQNATSHFDVDDSRTLMRDPSFSLSSVPDIVLLGSTLTRIRRLSFVNHTYPFWPERFLDWSKSRDCEHADVCCNIVHKSFLSEWLDYCLRQSTVDLPTHYNDTPIFDNTTFHLIGYTAMIPTSLRYSHRFSNLSTNIARIREGFGYLKGGWWTTEWYLMSTWFDLQRAVVTACAYSILISLVVVALFAFIQLRFQSLSAVLSISFIIVVCVGVVTSLGWVIGLLEAVILVLVVGLSFDYTLHYGASIPKEGCIRHKVEKAVERASVPVSLAAFSSLLAGAPMLLCSTHAFFQVGVFLVVSTSVSWIFSTFFFLPLLSLTLSSSRACFYCRSMSNLPLTEK